MATKRKTPESSSAATGLPYLLVPSAQLQEELSQRVNLGRQLLDTAPMNDQELDQRRDAYYSWTEFNEKLLQRSFDRHDVAKDYLGINIGIGGRLPLRQEWQHFVADVSTKIRRLEALMEQLPLYSLSPAIVQREVREAAPGTDVFIVHGHNNAVKSSVARFINQLLGVEPIILHEQVNRGRTIIEKFEAHAASAGFAVVLLTGDDEGGELGSPMRRRARQNVILELGYFVGRLGRDRVVILHEPDVETPGDLAGVLYVPLDTSGAWKNRVAREIRAAGVDVNLEALMR